MEEHSGGTPAEDPHPSAKAPPTLHREDCWTDDATLTLVQAWGERYIGCNRGHLRQQHWQEVADAVNSLHGGDHPRSHRTDVQCKYRIDTLKKRYKTEKARVVGGSNGSYVSPWPFFSILDALIASQLPLENPNLSPPKAATRQETPFTLPAVPGRPRSSKVLAREHHPRSSLSLGARDVFLRRKSSEPEREDSHGSGSRLSTRRVERNRGSKELLRAIKRLEDVYVRAERKKQKDMIELEKQRMEFTKDLEQQRMKWFVEMQVQLQKMEKMKKKSPPSHLPDHWLVLLNFLCI